MQHRKDIFLTEHPNENKVAIVFRKSRDFISGCFSK